MRRRTPFECFSNASYVGGFSVAAFLLRLAMGGLFFFAGWSKVMDDSWTAAAYLEQATGPFAHIFQSLAGSVIVDQLNMWGLLLIGVAFFLGLFVRTASFFCMILMVLYYFSGFDGNTAHGFIDQHVIYFLIALLMFVGGFGHIWGFDAVIERHISIKKSWLRIFFG